jgi:hypothetical protein
VIAGLEREDQPRHIVVLDGPNPDGRLVVERGKVEDAETLSQCVHDRRCRSA